MVDASAGRLLPEYTVIKGGERNAREDVIFKLRAMLDVTFRIRITSTSSVQSSLQRHLPFQPHLKRYSSNTTPLIALLFALRALDSNSAYSESTH